MERYLRNLDTADKVLFKKMTNLYDERSYDAGLVVAEQLATKYPDHPEIHGFKALYLNTLKRKEDAKNCIEATLKKHITNFTVWHLYGMIHRTNKNYEEARKAFQMALKQDESNVNVLRDLSILQLQLGDYPGMAESRRKILVANPTSYDNYNFYISALMLCKNWKLAVESFDNLFEVLLDESNKSSLKKPATNELMMMRMKVFEEMKDWSNGIKFIQKRKEFFCDDVRYNETLSRFMIKNGQGKKAMPILEELLKLNPNNTNYYKDILRAQGVKFETEQND